MLCLITFWIAQCLAQTSCNSGPHVLTVPIRNITLSNQLVSRGVSISVGTPAQNVAFWVQAKYVLDSLLFGLSAEESLTDFFSAANNTYVYDVGSFCDNGTTSLQCEGQKGGQFDEGASSTWSQMNDVAAAGGAVTDYRNAKGDIFGIDTLHLNSTVSFERFPIGVFRGGVNLEAQVLGLHTNSTLINALLGAKIIASRTWSIFWGLTGADPNNQMDGSLTFGGYDAAKITGPNSTEPLAFGPFINGQGCALFVTVTAINMNFPNGTNFNILGTSHGSALRMCVEPEYPILTLPYDIWQTFTGYAGGSNIGRSYFYGELFEADQVSVFLQISIWDSS